MAVAGSVGKSKVYEMSPLYHLPKAIRKGPAGSMPPVINTRLSGAVKVIAYLLRNISTNRYVEMLKEISDLEDSNQYKAVLKKLNINISKLL